MALVTKRGLGMDKVIILAFLGVIGVVIWAMLPASVETHSNPSVQGMTKSKNPSTATGSSQIKDLRRLARFRVDGKAPSTPKGKTGPGRAKGKTAKGAPSQPAPVATIHSDYGKSPSETIPAGTKRIAWPVATKGEFAVKNYVDEDKEPVDIYKRPPEDDPCPHFKAQVFKDSIRKFYGGLPAQGKLPSRVLAADVLPSAVISNLHMPADTELTMLGPHYTNDVKAYKGALAVPDDQSSVFGLSYVTPDGKSHRQYIRLNIEGN